MNSISDTYAGGIIVVPNYAALRSIINTPTRVYVQGAVTAGDGGQGTFTLGIGSAPTDNNGTFIVGATNWYYRAYSGALHVAWFGGFTAAALSACIAVALSTGKDIYADAGLYNMGTSGISITAAVNNFSFIASPDAIFQSTGTGSSPVIAFSNIGSNFKWSGGQYGYATAPTTRAADTLDFFGSTMVNIRLADIYIYNGANFGIWVQGLAASGSSNVLITNIKVSNTLGDGVHVENFDSQVTIDNIIGLNNQDDVAVCINYTPIHPNPTYNVIISNISATNHTYAVVKVFGVDGFTVSNVTGTGGTAQTSCIIQTSVGNNYGTQIINGVYSNIVGLNCTNVILGGVPAGSEFGNIIFDNIVGYNVGSVIDMVNASTANVHNVDFGKITATGPNGGSTIGLWFVYGTNITFGAIQVSGFYQNLYVTNCTNVIFNDYIISVDAYNTGGGSSFGVQIQYNTNLVLNDVSYARVNSPGTQNGIIVNFNTGVETKGIFKCATGAASTLYIFGSNTNVTGYIDRLYWSISNRSVTGFTGFTVAFSRTIVSAGVQVCTGATIIGGGGQAFQVSSITASQLTITPTATTSSLSMAGEVAVILN